MPLTDDQKQTPEKILRLHMEKAANSDLNPWVTDFDGILFSKLSRFFPDLAPLKAFELTINGNGWLTADGLYLISELAEDNGAELIEFLSPDNGIRLIGLKKEEATLPLKALARSGLRPANGQTNLGLCSFWGPCLGRRSHVAEALEELAAELAPELNDEFTVKIDGCQIDCRQAAVYSDLALIVEVNTSDFVVWLGGRHRPFREPITPSPWLKHRAD
ncbi:MAG: hypothetical protein LBV23_07425, partial [Deltaproteobacteria bacterium]|nr:hypothetical protein [Deltaproteobacteria bacterium]